MFSEAYDHPPPSFAIEFSFPSSRYLEKKRDIFPRFYFLSDPGLLEILGQASDPTSIQPHLAGLFDNLDSVKFAANGHTIIECFSREMDKLVLIKPVLAVGNVEVWLYDLMVFSQQVDK